MPVTAATGESRWRKANSISLQIGRPLSIASTTGNDRSEKPGLAGSTVYNFLLSDGMAVMGEGGAAFTGVIWAIALFLFFYARAMAKRGFLR